MTSIKNFDHLSVVKTRKFSGILRYEPNINGLLLRASESKRLRTYLETLEMSNFPLAGNLRASDPEEKISPYFPIIIMNYQADHTNRNDVMKILSHFFPQRDGFTDFAKDVFQTFQFFCQETEYSEVTGMMLLSLRNHREGVWHGDKATDLFGLKAYCSNGAALRSNTHTKNRHPSKNTLGTVARTLALLLKDPNIYVMQQGEFGILKGQDHDHPLIHTKPRIGYDDFRLSFLIIPTAESRHHAIEKYNLCKLSLS